METIIKTGFWYKKTRDDNLISSSPKKATLGVDQSRRFGITQRLTKLRVSLKTNPRTHSSSSQLWNRVPAMSVSVCFAVL